MYKTLKIYYEKETGEIIHQAFYNYEIKPNLDSDYANLIALNSRVKESIALLVLRNGAYAQDFQEGRLIKIDPESQELIFEYPNPENPDEPIIPDKPLSVEIDEVKQENKLLQQSLLELTSYAATQDERLATQEQALLELSTVLAGGDE